MDDRKQNLSQGESLGVTHVEKSNGVSAVSSAVDVSTRDEHEQDWTPEEEKALVKKIDRRVFPMLWFVFGLSLLDRANIGAAYIAGMGKDLGLGQGARYSIVLLVIFPTYAFFELPSNLVIRHFGAPRWLSFLIISFGLIVLGMGFVQSWQTLALCRALLGVFEAGVFPGSIFILGAWYRQFEIAKRVALFFTAALLAGGMGGLLAYAFSLVSVGDGDFAQGWRWIFILEGLITIATGLVAPFLLADFPERVSFLTPREKHIARARLEPDKNARVYVHPTIMEVVKMLVDWKLLLYCLQYYVAAGAGFAMSYFSPIILRQGMGFSYVMSQVLTLPPFLFAIIASFGLAWVSDKWQTRWPVLCAQSIIAIVGLIITLYGKLAGVRYFGLFLGIFGVSSNTPGTLAYGQSNTADQRKRGVVAAAMITVGALGGITGSTIFRSQDAPNYYPGMWATIGLQVLYTVVTFGMSQYLKRQNKLADEGKRPALEGVEGFRYTP